MSEHATLETVRDAWGMVFQVDPELTPDDALEAGFIARDAEVADLTAERDRLRSNLEALRPLLQNALFYHHDGYTDYPWAEDCPVCRHINKFMNEKMYPTAQEQKP